MEKVILCFLLLLGLFSVSARERHLPGTLSSQRNDVALLDHFCNNKQLDLVFVIDSSRSVRPYDFEKVKEFILTILQFLDISPDVTRVGLIQYGSTVKNEFSLKTFRRKQDVERAVRRMMHLATGTMTGLAIQYAMNIAFSESEGARPLSQNVPRVIMIVTDGRPQDPVADVAAKARNSGILIFAIGVGRVDMNTLRSIGSEPYEDHVFLVANFSQIETLTSVFQNKLCIRHMCSVANHDCDHFCINTPGSYICKCKQGYILNVDQRTCSKAGWPSVRDVVKVDSCSGQEVGLDDLQAQNLCEVEKHDCQQICVNTPGSYVCQCYDGYELQEDGKSCFVVDYCALNNQGCQHECVNTEDSYYCQCQKGFILNPDKKTCRRPDFCALQHHGCQHDCVNTDESYFCRCRQGFTLNSDKKTCKRIDVCALGRHGCEHECVNTEDSYMCRCQTGYTLNRDRKTCRRIDHCAEFNHGCEQLCLNTGESYVCQCSEGFIINEDLKTCSRVDYCLLSNHGCEHLCVNSERSFVCQCLEGYVLRSDGKSCKRRDVCKSVNHGCEHLCVSDGNSYVCKCRDGFTLREDRKTCRSKDFCKSVDHDCEHLCVNSDYSYVCKCYEGFVLGDDGKTCRNKNVCKSTDHVCEHVCINNGNSYTCKCHEGFILREDGKTCRSKDLCKSIEHGCEHICMNNDNSYICKCQEGFILEENGKTCRRCTEGPIDLVFVIDGSKSLGANNFEIVKEFVIGILDSLAISPKAARVGLLQYSTQVRTEFTLKQFRTSKDVKKAVSQMKYMGKGSMTGLALKQMTETSFTEAEGARRFSTKVPRVSIVFTDGRAQDEVSEWATKAKQNGITIYTVGIGKAVEEELREIASDPPEKHLFYAEDFSSMGQISEKLQKRICEGLEGHKDLPAEVHHSVDSYSEEPETATLAITDVLACSNFAVHHKYLFEEKRLRSTVASGNPSEDKKDPCKCENLMTFQNFANAEVKKLTQQLEDMSKRMEALENQLRYR